MTGKHRRLLQLMPLDGASVTSAELAVQMDVSVRSVKKYLGEVAQDHPGLVTSGVKGYRADGPRLAALLALPDEAEIDTPEKRVNSMIRRILQAGEPVPMAALEAEFYVGEDTLKKDLPIARRRLKDFDLFIDQRGGALCISGSEGNKRRLLSDLLYIEFNDRILSLSAIGAAFPGYDVGALKQMVLDACNAYHYFINEYALMSLVLDLLISIDRVRNNFLTMPDKSLYRFGEREQGLARTIVANIQQMHDVDFNQLEIDELTILLFSHLTRVDYKSLTMENVEDTVGGKVMSLVRIMKKELDDYAFLDLDNQDLMLRFTVHIYNLLARLEHHYVTKNPLTEQIKRSCPFIYEFSVILAGIINRETGHFIDQHETAYIALHIGSMLELQQTLRNKARCLLLYPQYYDYANKLVEQMTMAFGATLVICGVATQAEEIPSFGPVDMVLATVDLLPSAAYEIVPITPFFNSKDQQGVQNALERVVRKKKRERVYKSLMKISSPRLFSRVAAYPGEEEAICAMAERMIAQGYAAPGFAEAVLERERNYSTAYGDVAVPHALQMNARKTGMCVCLGEKSTPWGDGRVHIMLLFSVNEDEKHYFYEVFENLIVLLLEPGNALKVAASKTYEQFIENIMLCL